MPYLSELWRSFLQRCSQVLRVLYRHAPAFARRDGAVIIIRDGDRLLLIERADGLGMCFPGGRGKPGEPEVDTIRRELLEETGLALGASRFLFRYRETGGLSEFTAVYEGQASGQLRSSWEGTPHWLRLSEVEANLYAPQRPVLDYLKTVVSG